MARQNSAGCIVGKGEAAHIERCEWCHNAAVLVFSYYVVVMGILILLLGIGLLIAALHFHAIAQANVITKVEREWFERLFTGSRASKENLNEEGLQNRKKSNLCVLAGFAFIGCYLFFIN